MNAKYFRASSKARAGSTSPAMARTVFVGVYQAAKNRVTSPSCAASMSFADPITGQ